MSSTLRRLALDVTNSLVTEKKKNPVARKMGQLRWAGVSKEERAAHARAMVEARERKRRAQAVPAPAEPPLPKVSS